jgi:hypothetical protein
MARSKEKNRHKHLTNLGRSVKNLAVCEQRE